MSVTEQQAAAIASRGQVIVSASAGSGKTFVMIERLSSLIAEGADLSTILAVTFTNKAAAQMRDRARKKLLEIYRTAGEEEKKRLRAQLDALPMAEISTIHAFCGRLVRTYFYLAGVDPRFRIASVDRAEGKALSGRAMEQVFETAYAEGEAWFMRLLTAYFRKKKDKKLREIVAGLYASVRNVAQYRTELARISEETDPAAAEANFERLARFVAENYRARALRLVRATEDLIPMSESEAPKGLAALRALADAARAVAEAKDLFAMETLIADIPRSPARTAKDSPAALDVLAQIRALAKQIRALYADLRERAVPREEALSRYRESLGTASALAKLVLRYDDAYFQLKREAGVLDYGDLEHLTLAVLQDPEAREAVRAKYRYIFVDEYQDVNPLQSAILEAVSGGEIFLVGDKKQAIYGFRGSRTRFFTEKEISFGRALPLDRNFRSAGAVLEAVNRVFEEAMEGYVPMAGGDLYGDHVGEVCIHELPEEEKNEERTPCVYSVLGASQRMERDRVAEKILAIVETECGRRGAGGKTWFDPDTKACREVTYGDIAVLVRKKSGTADAVVRALSERGIPVNASAEVNICNFFEVRLLLDWLSYLDDPEQDIPMATAMLSAIGGFTDRELALIRLKTDRTLRLRKVSFRAACRAYGEGYRAGNDPLCNKLLAFFAKAQRYRILAQVKTASEMLALLLAEGLEAQIAAKGDSANRLARVRRLLEESKGAGSVHAFLRRVKDADEQISFSESGGEGAVRVLTMHAAKGLEFPVVILADLDTPFHGVDKDETMWTDEFAVAPKSFDFERKICYETMARRAAEISMRRSEIEGERNLLYVAMTRAKYRLHMILGEKDGAEAETGPDVTYSPDEAKRLSDFLPLRRLTHYFVSWEDPLPESVSRRSFPHRSDSAAVRRIVEAAGDYPFARSVKLPVKDSATGLMQRARSGSAAVRSEGETADMGSPFSTEIGLAYHAFLEHVRFGGDAGAELGRMLSEGLLSKEEADLLDEERLGEILAIPCLAALEGKKTWREYRFLVSFPAEEFYDADENGDVDVIFQGALDLLAEEENGYLIIDYKFSSHDDETIRRDYAVQMKLYRKTVAKIMRVAEDRVRVVIVNIAKGREIPV